jgi:hypothetical protein
MKKTEIRAVEMVRTIRDRLYEDTKRLSREDFVAFIRREAAKVTAEDIHATGMRA